MDIENKYYKPTHMGLRVKRNIPERTSEEVALSAVGFKVVCARINDRTPAIEKTASSKSIVAANASRPDLGSTANGVMLEMSHIASAIAAATTGGGILASSADTQASLGGRALT